MGEETVYLKFNIRVLGWLNLWPSNDKDKGTWRKIKDFSLILSVTPSFLAVLFDFIYQLNGNFDDISGMTENLCALAAIMGTLYLNICFVNNREKIQMLIFNLKDFNKISNDQKNTMTTEKFAALFTKCFLVYGIFGVSAYCVVPPTQIKSCRIKRAESEFSKDIPCGLVTRSWFPPGYNVSPYIEMSYIHQVYVCLVVTSITLTMTALLCGILMHIVTQIRYLREELKVACNTPENIAHTRKKVRHCIVYHNMIIEYAQNTDKAFNAMMLIHLTLTSFVISVLGFVVISVNSPSDRLRFGMHLMGWISMLLLTCYYGQTLIDESTSIGEDAYKMPWYLCEVFVQKQIKMMIMRAQKPLKLTAISMGVISLETFLGVMKTAYSYFTLLVNMK